MDINYKILWFEDTDESFETLSRRTERYVNSKNLRCTIDRIWGVSDFDMSKLDLNRYEILVVDLRLEDDSRGFDIIQAIRSRNYVNDILFYSAEGVEALEAIMKELRLEGVFITDRNHKTFIPKIQLLIDKSIKRSENVINIRGIVMDETSEFDTQMREIALAAHNLLTEDEIAGLKAYITEDLLSGRANDMTALSAKYSQNGAWTISDVISENDFGSMMKAKLLNQIFNLKSNDRIARALDNCKDSLPHAFGDKKIKFVHTYDNEILKFRNKLAHVKHLNAETPVFIGNINGKDYYCNTDFCFDIRAALIKYGDWFNAVYNSIVKA